MTASSVESWVTPWILVARKCQARNFRETHLGNTYRLHTKVNRECVYQLFLLSFAFAFSIVPVNMRVDLWWGRWKRWTVSMVCSIGTTRLITRKSFLRPWPMKIHPQSTRNLGAVRNHHKNHH